MTALARLNVNRAWALFENLVSPRHFFHTRLHRFTGTAGSAARRRTQSTFLTALERLGEFDPQRGDMADWLRYLSRNVTRDLLSRHRRGVQLQAVWDGIDDQLRHGQPSLAVRACPGLGQNETPRRGAAAVRANHQRHLGPCPGTIR
jgi:DNA-directed RNA polymerase specialized sigma24 family protein